MTRRLVCSLATIASLVTSALLNAQEPLCHLPSRECEQQIRQMLSGRQYLGAVVVDLKPGLVIKAVIPDSPAFRAALRPGDRLIAINGRSLTEASTAEYKAVLADARQTGRLWMIVQQRGGYKKVEVRLEPFPKEYIDKVIAGHLAQSHTATAGAQP